MAISHNTTTHRMCTLPEYPIWVSIKTRCRNTNHIAWKHYGGRGIKVCKGISASFAVFYSIVGSRPDASLQIDRTNNDGHYSCGECVECIENNWPMNLRWVTPKENSSNRRNTQFLTHKGKKQTITQWANELGITPATIFRRFYNGKSVEEILRPGLRRLGGCRPRSRNK